MQPIIGADLNKILCERQVSCYPLYIPIVNNSVLLTSYFYILLFLHCSCYRVVKHHQHGLKVVTKILCGVVKHHQHGIKVVTKILCGVVKHHQHGIKVVTKILRGVVKHHQHGIKVVTKVLQKYSVE